MPNIDWASLGWTALGYLLPAAVLVLSPLVVRYLQAHLTAKQFETLRQVAADAVTAAEQAKQTNPERYAYAEQVVQNYLTAHGIKLGVVQVAAAIESAVLTETSHAQPAPAKPAA